MTHYSYVALKHLYGPSNLQFGVIKKLATVEGFNYGLSQIYFPHTFAAGHIAPLPNGLFAVGGNPVPAAQIVYRTDAKVDTIQNGLLATTSYYTAPFRSAFRDPLSNLTARHYDESGQMVRLVDPLGQQTRFLYNNRGWLSSTIYPEGNSVELTYDVRGNPLTNVVRGKLVSDIPLTSTTAYVVGQDIAACTSDPKRCNLPSYAIDANGNRTDYEWSSSHGQLLSVSSAPDSSGVRPVTTYGYTNFTGVPLYQGAETATFPLLVSKQEKIDGSNVTTTTYSYDTANKFTMTEMVVDSGGLSLRTCLKFDTSGNVISSTEPKGALSSCP